MEEYRVAGRWSLYLKLCATLRALKTTPACGHPSTGGELGTFFTLVISWGARSFTGPSLRHPGPAKSSDFVGGSRRGTCLATQGLGIKRIVIANEVKQSNKGPLPRRDIFTTTPSAARPPLRQRRGIHSVPATQLNSPLARGVAQRAGVSLWIAALRSQ